MPGWRVALIDIGRLMLAGSARLRPYERAIIEQAKDHLSQDAYAALVDQLARVAFCQREHDDKMVGIFYSSALEFPEPEGEEEILRGKLVRPGNRDSAPFSVINYRGRIASIEFRKSPRAFREGAYRVEYKPRPWTKQKPMPEILDQEEH